MDMMTVRITGDIQVKHGDTIYLTPDVDQIHRFSADGLRIA
jgi:multiple sugar transport system ATP-binding protein